MKPLEKSPSLRNSESPSSESKKLCALRVLGVSYNEDVGIKELGTWWKCV